MDLCLPPRRPPPQTVLREFGDLAMEELRTRSKYSSRKSPHCLASVPEKREAVILNA